MGRLKTRDGAGFTLIELMVVLVIIAVLLAVAIPTLLGARDTANATAAQHDLQAGLTAEQVIYARDQAFTEDTTSALPSAEPAIKWTAVASATGNTVAVLTDGSTTAQSVVVQAQGRDNDCYAIYQTNGSGISQTAYMESTGTCGGIALPATAPAAQTLQSGRAAAHLGAWSTSW